MCRASMVWITVAILFLGTASAVAGENEVREVTLEEAQSIAVENSEGLELAGLDVAEARIQLDQAETAQLMEPDPTALMQARAGYELAHLGKIMAQDDLALNVQTGFYQVLQLKDMLDVAEEALASAERQLDETEQKYDAGTATRYDVIQATSHVRGSAADVVQAEHGLELAIMNFLQTLGLDLDDNVRPQQKTFTMEERDIDLEEDVAFALDNREEIIQLETAVEVAEKSVELADNDYTPDLELEMAEIQLQQAKVQLEEAKKLLTLEIHQSYTEISEAEERIPALKKEVEEAEELHRISGKMYEADMITMTELQDSHLAVVAAQNELITAISDYNTAQARHSYTAAEALRD